MCNYSNNIIYDIHEYKLFKIYNLKYILTSHWMKFNINDDCNCIIYDEHYYSTCFHCLFKMITIDSVHCCLL